MIKLGSGLSYDVDDLSRVVMFGKTGSGKSYAARKIVENLEGQLPLVVIDPPGVWWGMRLSAAGNPRRDPIPIVGGRRADIPLQVDRGRVYAEWVVKSKASVIFDLSDEDIGSLRKFVYDFLSRLFTLKGKASYPMQLVLEECDEYAPQNPSKEGPSAVCLSTVSRVCRVGRTRGVRFIAITQRPARMHKDVATQGDFFYCGKLTGPQDREAVKKWLAEHGTAERRREVIETLPTLGKRKKPGEGFWWNTIDDTLVRGRCDRIKTFDSMAAPTLDGEGTGGIELGRLDVEGLSEALEAMVVEAKANDPKALKAEIARLQKALEKNQADPEELARVGEQLADAKMLATFRENQLAQVHQAMKPFVDAMNGIMAQTVPEAVSIRLAQTPPKPAEAESRGRASAKGRVAPSPVPAASADNGVSPSAQRLLDAVGWWTAIGIDDPTNQQVGALLDLSPKGSRLRNIKSEASSAGLVTYPAAGRVRLTDEGLATATVPSAPPTAAELRRTVQSVLTPSQRGLFDVLLEAWPNPMDNDELGAAVGLESTGSRLRNLKAQLSSRGLIEYPQRGQAKAVDWLF